MPTPIAVQLYSLREEAARDFASVLRRVGEIGYAGVELAGLHGLSHNEFRSIADASGLTVSSVHAPSIDPEPFKALLDDAVGVGCSTVVSAFLPPAAFETLDAVKASAEKLQAAYELASAAGVALGYHNHWWEFENRFDGRTAWSHLFSLVDPAVFSELDIYWSTVGGTEPCDAIAELGSRVQLLHVKDGPGTDPKLAMTAVGSGSLDIVRVLDAAPSARWHIVELDRCDTDMTTAVAESYTYLTGTGRSTGRA